MTLIPHLCFLLKITSYLWLLQEHIESFEEDTFAYHSRRQLAYFEALFVKKQTTGWKVKILVK